MADADRLTLRYVPLATARRWDRNPKRHDLERIAESIRRRGFRDPPAFDATLDAFVEGNGRTEVLEQMQAAGEEPPRGIAVDRRNGAWRIPVVFGLDAESVRAAEEYAIDHNSLTLGDGFELTDVARLYDAEGLAALTAGWGENGAGDFSGLVLDFLGLEPPEFDEVPEGEQGRLDQKATVRCPHCGEEFTP